MGGRDKGSACHLSRLGIQNPSNGGNYTAGAAAAHLGGALRQVLQIEHHGSSLSDGARRVVLVLPDICTIHRRHRCQWFEYCAARTVTIILKMQRCS